MGKRKATAATKATDRALSEGDVRFCLSCKRHCPKTSFRPDRACCEKCLKKRRDRQTQKRGTAKRQKHALAMGDAVNAHARAAGLVAETHGAALNLPFISGEFRTDAAAPEGASETSGGGTAPGELRVLLEQRQQSLKVAHRLFVAHQSATALRARAKSPSRAVSERTRTANQECGVMKALFPGLDGGVCVAADGKETYDAGAHPTSPPRFSAASLAWRESPATSGETRPSRLGVESSTRAATPDDGATRIASVQQIALEQLRTRHLQQLQQLQSLQSPRSLRSMSGPGGAAMGALPGVVASPGGSSERLALGE